MPPTAPPSPVADRPARASRPERVRVARGAGRLAFELLVVFTGVYMAFLLNEYTSDRQTRQRQAQLYEALSKEVDTYIEGAERLAPLLDSLHADWQARYRAGERPEPLYLAFGGIDLPPRSMWDASVASGALTLLDVDVLRQVAYFYHTLDVLLDRYEERRAFAEQMIVPYLDEGAEAFYVPETGELKSSYRYHMQRVANMIRLIRIVNTNARAAKAALQAGAEPEPTQTHAESGD